LHEPKTRRHKLTRKNNSIQELSDASTGDASVFDNNRLIRLWRSIILSSIEQTAYPYCLWIKALPLGHLEILLDDIARDGVRKAELFAPPLQDFFAERDVTRTRQQVKYTLLDTAKIITMVADKVTSYVKESADRDDRVVALASLEGHQPPADALPRWLSRLSLLTSLTLREGNVLGPATAEAIRTHCPAFRELRCHWCMGEGVDKTMAGFLTALPANAMETFTILSMNQLGAEALKALGHHAGSLRSLGLASMRDSTWEHFGALGRCVSLESLSMEGLVVQPVVNWEAEHKQSFLDVIAWLKECRQLRELEMIHVPSTTQLLAPVFQSPSVQLRTLRLQLQDAGTDNAFWDSLGHQTTLKSLGVRWKEENNVVLTPSQQTSFVDSVCACCDLVYLDITNTPLTLDDLGKMRDALPQLQDLTFDADWLTDPVLLVLARMGNLRAVNINATSSFTSQGIMEFVVALDEASSRKASGLSSHAGFLLNIMNQNGADKLSEQEERMLQWELESRLGGKLDIGYERDPDEPHEDDDLFSG
jgi:hypothetical protein